MRSYKKYILSVIFLAVSSGVLHSADFPKPKGWVSDYAGVLSDGTRSKLDSELQELEAKTSAEVAVVIIKNLNGLPIEDYTMRLAESWKIGKKGKDNGVLFLVSVEDKHARIEVGYGLEGILPDGKCGDILRENVVPNFKKNDPQAAVIEGSSAIIAEVYKEYGNNPAGTAGASAANKRKSDTIFTLLFIFIWIVMAIVGSFQRSRRKKSGFWGYGGYGGGFGGGGGGFGGFGGGGFGGGGASV